MQIVILDGKALRPEELDWSGLKELGTLSIYDRTDEKLVTQRLRGADAVFTNKVKLTREQMEAGANLKFVGVLATGYDIVDVKGARELGLPVCNVPGYATEPVAELTFALLLELAFQVAHHSNRIRQGAWTASPDFCWWDRTPLELFGKTMGIIGCGTIGKRVAEIALAMGMRVIGFANHRRAGFPGTYVSLEELLATSDVISLHCSANSENRQMINKETLSLMKEGAFLINTARGALINEVDVRDALLSGKLGGYGADVVSSEPVSIHNPLLQSPNCFLTGHYAWTPLAARQRILDVSADNLRSFLNGTMKNVVNGR